MSSISTQNIRSFTMKYVLALGFLLTALQGRAQFQNNFTDSIQAPNRLELTGDYNLGSTGLNPVFMNTFYLKNHIGDDLKSNTAANLRDMNYFGGDVNYGLHYTHFNKDSVGLWGMKNVGYFIGLKNRQHIDGRFSKDLFNIVFNGNQTYRGKTADLSNFSLNEIFYQQLEFGLIKNFSCNQNKYTLGAGLSLLNGQKQVSVNIGNASLYTQQDGEYLDLTSSVSIQQSDTSRQKFGASNGLGLATHFYFSYQSPLGSQVKFEVSDLGFIRWNNASTQVRIDTSVHFDGVGVNNIFNFKDPAYSGIPSDSAYIARFLKHVSHAAYNSYLPALFQLSFNRKINSFTFLSGLKYRINANFIPYAFMGTSYQFNPGFYAALTLGFGGYSKLNIGLELGKKFPYGISLAAGSQFVNGYLAPAQGSAQGTYLFVCKTF